MQRSGHAWRSASRTCRPAIRGGRRAGALAAFAVAITCIAPTLAAQDSFESGRDAYMARRFDDARRIWLALAETADMRAQFGLGTLYHEGAGVARDPVRAAKWFLLAGRQGYAAAQFNLGNAYQRGDGVEQSHAEASAWWRKAADQEFAPAQYNLATQYYFGRGVPRDKAIALIYYRRAAENGHPAASEVLAKLERDLSPEGEPPGHPDAASVPAQSEPPRATKPVAAAPASPPAAPEQVAPAPSRVEPAPSPAEWVMAQPPGWFTIQLVSLGSESSARGFVESRKWPQPVGVLGFDLAGKRYYSVLYGAFPDREAAQRAVRELPAGVLAGKPWVRSFESVQALTRE